MIQWKKFEDERPEEGKWIITSDGVEARVFFSYATLIEDQYYAPILKWWTYVNLPEVDDEG